MLLLTSTSDKIQIVTAQASDIDVHADWIDLASGATTPGRTNTSITTATTTDVVAAPAASTVRNVKSLYIGNAHASTACTVTIQHTDGTTVIELEKVTLLAGERIALRDNVPTRVVDANGVEKTNPNALVTSKRLSADLSNSTTTAAKVTNLDLACPVGTYIFEYFVLYTSSVVTTGIKLGCNHSGTVASFVYDMYGTTADITTNTSLMDQDVLLTTGATMSSWAARAKTTTAPMISSGVDTINVDVFMMISGLVIVTADGNMELYHASETANSTTVKAGSCIRLSKVA